MDAPITQDQLYDLAGRYFAHATTAQIPEKIWLDCYVAAGQWYLRATWSSGFTTLGIVRLAALSVALDELYGTELIPVCYPSDAPWDEFEEANRRLNDVW
jgi:hypothetical protein